MSIRHSILALLDQDDVWYPKKLASVKDAFERDPQAAIVCHSPDKYGMQ